MDKKSNEKAQTISDAVLKILSDNGIKVGLVSFVDNDEPIIALHGDFYESVKLLCQGSERIKEQIVKDLKITTIPGRI
jgi:hypothetical protein